MSSSAKKFIGTTVLVVGAVLAWWFLRVPRADRELRALVYIGYDEKEVIDGFKKDTGITMLSKTFFGGDEMMSLLKASNPGDFDIVVVDPEYLQKLVQADILSQLVPVDYQFEDYYSRFQHFTEFYVNGRMYAVPVRFGVNGLVFNESKVKREDVRSYRSIWSDSLSGRIGLIDQYLVSMGAVSKAIGNRDAYDLTPEAFDTLRAQMAALKPRLKAVYSIPEMFRALAAGEIWVLPCGGESVVYNLRDQGNFDWLIPDEGGIMWVEGLAILKQARHTTAARQFIQWAQTPTAQALLATRRAYASNVPNRKAYDLLSPVDRAILRSSTETELESLLGRLSVRTLPRRQSEAQWIAAWQEFRAH